MNKIKKLVLEVLNKSYGKPFPLLDYKIVGKFGMKGWEGCPAYSVEQWVYDFLTWNKEVTLFSDIISVNLRITTEATTKYPDYHINEFLPGVTHMRASESQSAFGHLVTEDSQKSVLPYKSGQRISIWVNQGERDAWVLGTLEDQIIVEYEMPSGTTALNILQNAVDVKFVKSVSYKSCPKKWIQAIRDGVGSWEGICQRNGQIDFPEQDEETQADGFWKEPTVDSRNFPKRLTEREELEEQHGQVWNTKELQQDFTVQGFASPCVVVIRKSDGTKGTLEFIHQPRFYFDFVAG